MKMEHEPKLLAPIEKEAQPVTAKVNLTSLAAIPWTGSYKAGRHFGHLTFSFPGGRAGKPKDG